MPIATAPQNVERRDRKRFEIMSEKRDVTLLKLSADWIHGILYSLRLCVADLDTFVSSKDCFGVWKEEPALQCRRQNYASDTLSLKPSSGATEAVLD